MAAPSEKIVLVDVGERGPRGDVGPQGPAGAEWRYVHTQESPALVWTVAHGLGGYPNVTIVDSADRVVEGDVEYLDVDTIRVTLSHLMGGSAFLS